MTFSPKNFLSLFGLCIFLFSACAKLPSASNSENAARNDANPGGEKSGALSVKDDVEELGKIIKLPFVPEEATWREESANLPNGKKITAVVKFSAQDSARISEAGNNKSAADIEAETWFPAELVAQSQLSGDESLKGEAFAADEFLQAPYKQGKITRVGGTNYFVLELSGD